MDIDEALNENFQKVLKDGPRLRMDYTHLFLRGVARAISC